MSDPAPPVGGPVDAHRAEVEAWRAQRLAKLRTDEGWLVVAGLFWLEEGANPFGSAPENAIAFPAHAPAHAGHFEVEGGQVTVIAAPGTNLLVQGQPITRAVLRSDEPGPAEVCTLGDLRFFVMMRDGRPTIRLRDLRSPRRTNFTGIPHFPVSPGYRISARLVPHATPTGQTTIAVTNHAGKVAGTLSPGRIEFELSGRRQSLDAFLDDASSKRLTILFRDATSGNETYGAGRFLYSEGLPRPEDGLVTLDFNKAYNPPCALNPLVVCPLPPPQNRLDVRVEAGEKLPDDPG